MQKLGKKHWIALILWLIVLILWLIVFFMQVPIEKVINIGIKKSVENPCPKGCPPSRKATPDNIEDICPNGCPPL